MKRTIPCDYPEGRENKTKRNGTAPGNLLYGSLANFRGYLSSGGNNSGESLQMHVSFHRDDSRKLHINLKCVQKGFRRCIGIR